MHQEKKGLTWASTWLDSGSHFSSSYLTSDASNSLISLHGDVVGGSSNEGGMDGWIELEKVSVFASLERRWERSSLLRDRRCVQSKARRRPHSSSSSRPISAEEGEWNKQAKPLSTLRTNVAAASCNYPTNEFSLSFAIKHHSWNAHVQKNSQTSNFLQSCKWRLGDLYLVAVSLQYEYVFFFPFSDSENVTRHLVSVGI